MYYENLRLKDMYFVSYIRVSLKNQKIIKQRSSSRKLFETVNFAFMEIFDSLVRKSFLGYFIFL